VIIVPTVMTPGDCSTSAPVQTESVAEPMVNVPKSRVEATVNVVLTQGLVPISTGSTENDDEEVDEGEKE
jgi:hypothetical protein